MLTINGWTILAHPCLYQQLEKLIAAVDAAKAKDPKNYQSSSNAKLLAAIYAIAFKRIPANPADPRYRQGDTLGSDYKHWFRDKFGNGRFRLFFRFNSNSKIIIYAWVNDSNTLREYGAKTDAYAVFSQMLDAGNPPDDWGKLLAACSKPSFINRLKQIFGNAATE